MAERNLRLVYPPSLVNVPIIYQLIRHYNWSVNIRRAQVTDEEGWIDIQITADPTEIDAALHWLAAQGVEVHVLDSLSNR